MRRARWIASALLLWPALASAERTIAERIWDGGNTPEGATVAAAAGAASSTLRIEGRNDRATTVSLWTSTHRASRDRCTRFAVSRNTATYAARAI